jgi:hypothetical protein
MKNHYKLPKLTRPGEDGQFQKSVAVGTREPHDNHLFVALLKSMEIGICRIAVKFVLDRIALVLLQKTVLDRIARCNRIGRIYRRQHPFDNRQHVKIGYQCLFSRFCLPFHISFQ